MSSLHLLYHNEDDEAYITSCLRQKCWSSCELWGHMYSERCSFENDVYFDDLICAGVWKDLKKVFENKENE